MTDSSASSTGSEANTTKKRILFTIKLAFSIAMLVFVFSKILGRDGVTDLTARLENLSWGWVAAAVLMQLIAIGFATVRWQRLLVGQGLFPSWRFLAGSILIARFWGAFTPGGFTGFGGWRIYDVAVHTRKVARATATIGVEMVLGQVAFGVVVIIGSLLAGARFIGTDGVMIVIIGFLSIIIGGLLFLAHPQWFLFFTRWLPEGVRTRVQTLVDAVSAYRGKSSLLIQATVLGVGVHAFNNFIYVCAAKALGVGLTVGEVFFGSSLQILSTVIPVSINGIGLRENTALALYTSPDIGLPATIAVLIPILGFACEMFVSAFGGLIFASRRVGYSPEIRVENPEHERLVHEHIETAPPSRRPDPIRGFTLGLGAGLLAGVVVGLCEALVIVAGGGGPERTGLFVLVYGTVAYALLCAALGAGLGGVVALSGRWMRRAAMPEGDALGRTAAFLVAAFAFVLGAFRIRRDIFDEELVWKSIQGLLVLLLCAGAAVLSYLVLSALFRALMRGPAGRVLLRPWGVPLVVGSAIAILAGGLSAFGGIKTAHPEKTTPADVSDAEGNILFIVVDTLRADHLPAYGYTVGHAPNLDAFSSDAIRFDQAFVNSSWTRPSFASLLSGRLPSSHRVMAKKSVLPDSVVTLPEALKDAGYATGAFVTNYNLAPYYNFQQGFDEYNYLTPKFILGADDASAKLLIMQFVRRGMDKVRSVVPFTPVQSAIDEIDTSTDPGGAYQDAETLNTEIVQWLDRTRESPWFLFTGYMDPHDPYFEHPYVGPGFARAGNQRPDPSLAPQLRKLYDGEITYWDKHFGQLVAELKSRGIYDTLTIVVSSDHGEEFFDHGGFWHGTTLYDEQVRVPLYVKLPQSRRGGTVVRHWVQSIDIMPTLLREHGLAVPKDVQGGDLFAGADAIYAEESHEGNVLESARERRGTEELKLIKANPANPRKLLPVELYRVDTDPKELKNLASSEATEVEAIEGTLAALRDFAKTGAAVELQLDKVTDEQAERLKALGYVQ